MYCCAHFSASIIIYCPAVDFCMGSPHANILVCTRALLTRLKEGQHPLLLMRQLPHGRLSCSRRNSSGRTSRRRRCCRGWRHRWPQLVPLAGQLALLGGLPQLVPLEGQLTLLRRLPCRCALRYSRDLYLL